MNEGCCNKLCFKEIDEIMHPEIKTIKQIVSNFNSNSLILTQTVKYLVQFLHVCDSK